jgi:predicted phosphodiesterase
MKNLLYEFDKDRLREFRKLVVVGDIHGDINTISLLKKTVDFEKDYVLFLGDYADRGEYGVEVIDAVNTWIDKYQNVIALKGNHEDYDKSGNPRFSPRTLIPEVGRKIGKWNEYFDNEFKPFVEKLYLAAIIPSEILFVHGGISSKIKTLDDLRYPTREVEIDVLWSDPSTYSSRFSILKETRNSRGLGVEFGKDITNKVCNNLGVKKIIRSHQPQKARFDLCYEHDGKVMTTSSTTVYDGKIVLAFIDFNNNFKISFHIEPRQSLD